MVLLKARIRNSSRAATDKLYVGSEHITFVANSFVHDLGYSLFQPDLDSSLTPEAKNWTDLSYACNEAFWMGLDPKLRVRDTTFEI